MEKCSLALSTSRTLRHFLLLGSSAARTTLHQYSKPLHIPLA